MSLIDFLRGTDGAEETGVGDGKEVIETLEVRICSSLGKEPLDINGREGSTSE